MGARSTIGLAQRRERPGCHPVFQNIGAVSADQNPLVFSVPGRWTDPNPGSRVCARSRTTTNEAGFSRPRSATTARRYEGSAK
jgi:hypothetical protein